MRQRRGFNPKRRFRDRSEGDIEGYKQLASAIQYGGNPEHKKNPGDFGLTPPSGPRSGKSLCDTAQIFSKNVALRYLREGLQKGLVSDRFEGQWPKNIWTVTEDGIALEMQLENADKGIYHGYPMPESDPFIQSVLQQWTSHEQN